MVEINKFLEKINKEKACYLLIRKLKDTPKEFNLLNSYEAVKRYVELYYSLFNNDLSNFELVIYEFDSYNRISSLENSMTL